MYGNDCGPSNNFESEDQGGSAPPKRNAGSEDKVVLSVYVSWNHNFPSLMQKLEIAKRNAGEQEGDDSFEVDDITFVVAPSGYKLASEGKQGPHVAYRAIANGVSYGFRKDKLGVTNTPNVHIQVDSLCLIESGGFDPIWETIQETIRKLGGYIHKNIVSRIDPCVDLVGIPVSAFVAPFRDERYLCRATTQGQYISEDLPSLGCPMEGPPQDELLRQAIYRTHKRDTGLTIGRTAIMCRIYDKILTLKNRDPLKEQAMRFCRYGTAELPAVATRVEFQLRRSFFRSLSVEGLEVNSIQDWQKHRASIMVYLCTKWLRFCAAPFNPKHPERAEVIPEWTMALEHFLEWCQGEPKQVIRRRKLVKARVDQLLLQASGCLQSAAMLAGKAVLQASDFIDYTTERLRLLASKQDFWRKLELKKELYESRLPWHVKLAEIRERYVIRSDQPSRAQEQDAEE